MQHTTIIAEVGECFNGDMGTAHEMIRVAKSSGCDIVKFQILDMDEVAADDPEREWFAKIELDQSKVEKLITWAANEDIDILFTPVSVKTAQMLLDSGQDKVKIASSFVQKDELISFIDNHFKLVYASTGMSSLDEVARMVSSLNNTSEIRLLHCISEYPTGPLLENRGLTALKEEDAHLEMMMMLKEKYPELRVGYSDHTDGVFVPVVAAAMGADIIEKHFTMDRKTPIDHFKNGLEYMGTDHVVSVEPAGLIEMVEGIRRVERIKGDYRWYRSEGENVLMEFLKRRYTKRE